MSAEFPSAWGQTCPRSVRLSPGGLLVPAATLRVLLRNGRHQELLVTGHAMEPGLRDGATVCVRGVDLPRVGDLALCDIGGWGDLVRLVDRTVDGAWRAALDVFPLRRIKIQEAQVLGIVEPAAGGWPRWLARIGWPSLRAPFAGLRFFARRIERAPDFGDGAGVSVQEKYRQQVGGYDALQASNLDNQLIAALTNGMARGGSILVAGCGAGSEAVHLAGLGYRVTAFDVLPEMARATRAAAAKAGRDVEVQVADLREFDWPGRRFEAAYLTPLLYSFIPGRSQRVDVLRRLARHLVPGGLILLSAQPYRGATERLQTAIACAHRRWHGARSVEPGDWYTWFMTPKGDIGYSYLHRFSAAAIKLELGAAGLRLQARIGAHFLLGGTNCSGAVSEPAQASRDR